jgi:hypothetical protein
MTFYSGTTKNLDELYVWRSSGKLERLRTSIQRKVRTSAGAEGSEGLSSLIRKKAIGQCTSSGWKAYRNYKIVVVCTSSGWKAYRNYKIVVVCTSSGRLA